MLDGTYELNINTPMGNIPCKLVLWKERESLSGRIEMMGSKSILKDGKIEDNKFAFSGNVNTPMGNINYNILGILTNDILNIYAETNKGRFKLEGKRV